MGFKIGQSLFRAQITVDQLPAVGRPKFFIKINLIAHNYLCLGRLSRAGFLVCFSFLR